MVTEQTKTATKNKQTKTKTKLSHPEYTSTECRFQGVSRVLLSFLLLGARRKVTFAQDIPYKQVYELLTTNYYSTLYIRQKQALKHKSKLL